MKFNKQELCNFFKVAESSINTNFPKFCSKQLAKGWLITKEGYGKNAIFNVEKSTPQQKNKSEFSSRPAIIAENLPNEIWVPCCITNVYEVSNLGRVRNTTTKVLSHGSINSQGYAIISILNKNYQLHRIVWQSFNPNDDLTDFAIDHINGIRKDNRLENLRKITIEENTMFMKMNRLGINKEITRLINKYGYEETLKLLHKF